MRTPMARSALLLALTALIAACGAPAASQEPTAAPAPTAAPSATPAPTAAPSATPAPTAAPSATPAPPSPTPAPPTPTPDLAAGALTLARGSVSSRPFAVTLDNHPNAYPQTGMDRAVLVFEALAEFGLTRYLAVFVPGISPELDTIGPVRSARPYFVEWAKGLRSVYVHAGGSPEGLLLAETAIEIVNMDALRGNAAGYTRRSSQRAAPHNLYTSSADIAAFAEAQGAPADPAALAEIGFPLKPAAPAAERPAAQSFSYFFIYREAFVGWSYDPGQNDYLYFRQSRPHVDAATGQQLRFANVIVLEVPERPIPGDSKGRIEQQVVGEGPARVFRDGTMVEAVWRKPAGFAQLQIVTPGGEEIAMNPGPIWIAAIPSLENLTIEGGQ